MAETLSVMGVFDQIDQNTLARYCVAYVRWRRAIRFITENGEFFTVKDAAGKTLNVKLFPQVHVADKVAKELTKLEQEMGLTPSSRTRINVTDSKKAGKAGTEESGKARFFTPAPLKLA
jgi:P27 family predicted phage terminase small subunit